MSLTHDHKVTNGLKIVLTIGLIFFFQQIVKARVNQNQYFLQNVGVWDSLYSKILNKSRKIYIQLPAGYTPDNDQKYPVAFVLEGEMFFPTVNDVQNFNCGGFTPEIVLEGSSNDKNRIQSLRNK